ncbi:MAG: T9SS type A sorting domain-containing protein [Ignavibacteriales bacterium]|nr:T9SS type A sorting domain-containing protein [Ignavibacteriales bacterium]
MIRLFFSFLTIPLICTTALTQTPFWRGSNGPYGGIVDYLTVHPNGYIFAAARSNGIFRSTNAGTSWQDVSAGLQEVTVWTFAVHPNGNIFAGSDGGGVYRSTNLGSSWNKIGSGMDGMAVLSLAVDTSGVMYAGTVANGLWRSTDAGTTWQVLSTPLNNKFIYTLAVDKSADTATHGNIYAGILTTPGEFGVYRSTDGGTSWGVDSNTISTSILSLHVGNDGTLYAGTQANGVLRFTSALNFWEAYNAGITTGSVYFVTSGPAGELYACTNEGGVFRRRPGETWQQVNTGLENRYVLSLALSSEGTVMAGTGGAGIYESALQTVNWSSKNNGFSSLDRPVLHKTPEGRLYAGSYRGGLFKSDDHGGTWTSVHSIFKNHGILSIASSLQGDLYVGTNETPSVYRSRDNGLNWTPLSDGLSDPSTYSMGVTGSGTVFAASTTGMNRLDAQSDKWVPINVLANLYVNDIVTIDSSLVLVATESGVYRSTNAGTTWTLQFQGMQTAHLSIKALFFLPNGTVAAASDLGGVYISQDSGKSWDHRIGGLSNLRGRALTANLQGELFLGTSGGGVFRSTYDGLFWSVLNSGIGSLDIRSMVTSTNGVTFAGSYRSGLFQSIAPTVSVETFSAIIPRQFSLAQNYPNPFNPSTTIRFELAEPAFVRLKIFDGLGREIATLINGEMPAAAHSATFDLHTNHLSHLPTGIYYYRLTAGAFSQSRRMILLK